MHHPVTGLARLAALSAAAMLTHPAIAQPDEPGVAVPFGLTLGAGTVDGGDWGFLLGGEVSVAIWDQSARHPWWYGAYVDGLYDFGHGSARFSIGPELGYGVVGLDGGLVIQRDDGVTSAGVVGRMLLSFVVVHGFVRAGTFPGDDAAFAEIGVLLKLPWLVQFTP